jgi:hypothetical protein
MFVEVIESGGAAFDAPTHMVNPPSLTIVAAEDPDVLASEPDPSGRSSGGLLVAFDHSIVRVYDEQVFQAPVNCVVRRQ